MCKSARSKQADPPPAHANERRRSASAAPSTHVALVRDECPYLFMVLRRRHIWRKHTRVTSPHARLAPVVIPRPRPPHPMPDSPPSSSQPDWPGPCSASSTAPSAPETRGATEEPRRRAPPRCLSSQRLSSLCPGPRGRAGKRADENNDTATRRATIQHIKAFCSAAHQDAFIGIRILILAYRLLSLLVFAY